MKYTKTTKTTKNNKVEEKEEMVSYEFEKHDYSFIFKLGGVLGVFFYYLFQYFQG